MSSTLACPCHMDPVHYFDDKTRKPCTGPCGHTACLECIKVHRFTRCPFCGLNEAFSEETPVNYIYIDMIENYRKRFWEEWKKRVDTKNLDAEFYSKIFEETQRLCSSCGEPVKIPRFCLTCDHDTFFELPLFKSRERNALDPKITTRMMCTDCAIDNHEDKGHKIVKEEMNKNLKKAVTMEIAENILNIFESAIDMKKGVVGCLLRQLKIEIIGQNLLNIFEELEYVEEGQCGYLGELIKKELIKKYMENIDEKLLDLFSIEGNPICDCTRQHQEFVGIIPLQEADMIMRGFASEKPEVFATGCPFHLFEFTNKLTFKHTISEKIRSPGYWGIPMYRKEPNSLRICFPATTAFNNSNCPLCVYHDYDQHQKKDFLMNKGKSVIEEFCKTEMIPLDKCCLRCLDRLNECQFLWSCENLKESCNSNEMLSNWYREKEQSKKPKSCYQNCFMKNSSIWNFVIINHMMAVENLHEVIMHEIEQTVGFVDCQLQKNRMKETVNELYNGLNCVQFWEYFDHLSKPIEMDALLKSFKQQWKSFLFGHGEQKAGSRCKCTVIWNKISENEVKREKYEDLETKLIIMARYSMTEEIHGCPMEYNRGIELNKNVMEELEDAVDLLSIDKKRELILVENEKFNCLIKKIDNQIHQPYTGSCGHTICSQCVEKTHNGDCPVCGDRRSFDEHQLNEDLLREIETMKQNAWEMFKKLWNCEAAKSGACSKCNKSSSDLYILYLIICGGLDKTTMMYAQDLRVQMESTADVLTFSRNVLCQKCASARPHDTKQLNSILFWKPYLKKTNGIFLLELLEEKIIRGEKCELLRTELQLDRKKLIIVLKKLNYQEKQDPEYERELIRLKMIEILFEDIDRKTKQLSMPDGIPRELTEEICCPMCAVIDCGKNHNRYNWITILEHLWSNQSPRFEKCCFRCLIHLDKRYSGTCQAQNEVVNIKTMSNKMSEGIEKGQLENFNRVLTILNCKDCNRDMGDKERLVNLTIREYFFCLLRIIIEGLSKTTFTCHLRKIRINNLVYHFFSEVLDVWLMNNHFWIVCWKFVRTSTMVENLKIQFKKLKDEMDKEGLGIKCECTDIWERNQNMMKHFGHEDCEDKKTYRNLEDSMEEMARFSLEKDLDGCPMEYNHGIELDKESVRKLKESTVLGAEPNRNECLCVKIDSLGPISGAILNQIMTFFMNWWEYEASYPHLLCHECVERLDLVLNRLETIWLGVLTGFNKCYLRELRMVKTFQVLIDFIHGFQISKGRVFKSDMEKMTKVFNNFISQWNWFQSNTSADQQSLTAGTVCHCIQTLKKIRSLQNANISREVKEEYASLVETSNMLSELNLTEIISGCPLNFDHRIDVKCFYREHWDKPTDIADSCRAS